MIKFITKMGKRVKSVKNRISGKKNNGDNNTNGSKQTTVGKVKTVASSLVVNAVSAVENAVWIFFIFLLISSLIVASIIFAIVGSAFGVVSFASTAMNNININVSGGGGIVDYNTYDWYGNMTANLLKLKGNDKNYYRLIAMSYQLVEYSKTSPDREKWKNGVWDTYVGLGSAFFESGLMLPSEDKNVLETAFPFRSAGDGKGDDPLGITFTLADSKSEDYTWGIYDYKACKNQDVLQSNVEKVRVNRGVNLNVNDAFGIYYYPGAFKWTLLHTATRAFGGDMGVETQTAYIKDKLKEYGVEQSQENVNIVEIMSMYSCHHGTDIDALKQTIEVSVATLAYCDGSLDNMEFVIDGTSFVSDYNNMYNAKDAVFGEYISCDTGTSIARASRGSGYGLKIKHNGKTTVEKNKTLFELVYNEYGSKHPLLKTVVTTLTPSYGGTKYSVNYPSGAATYLIGKAVVKYIADQCNIVLQSSSSSAGAYTKGTKTCNALLNFAEDCYKRYGVGVATEYEWIKGNNDPAREWGMPKDDWCAMTVNYLFGHTMINGTSISVADKIRELTADSNKIFSTAFADIGYDQPDKYNVIYGDNGSEGRTSKTSEKYVTVHYNACNVAKNEFGVSQCKKDNGGKITFEDKYKPQPGDIVVYGKNQHVGIVAEYKESEGIMITYEGNTGDNGIYNKCKREINGGTFGWANAPSYFISINFAALEQDFSTPSTTSGNSSTEVSLSNYIKGSGATVSNITGNQLVIVKSSGTSAQVTALEKKSNGKWSQVLSTSGYVGSDGVGSASESVSKTPKGVHYLGKNFGGFGIGMSGLKIGWKNVASTQSYWGSSSIDNKEYRNQFYTGKKQGDSEDLTAICNGGKGAYKYAVLIEYNYPNATKNGGSAFFLHIGSSPTAGCVAIPESDMLSVVKWLDKSKSPQILIF